MLFGGEDYEAQGGTWDFIQSFDILADAQVFAMTIQGAIDWWEILDRETGDRAGWYGMGSDITKIIEPWPGEKMRRVRSRSRAKATETTRDPLQTT